MSSRRALARIPGLIKAKRRETKVGLREAARASNISPSTLSRLERGLSSSLPDTDTLANLAAWLGVSTSVLMGDEHKITSEKEPELKTPEQVEVYLRADRNLKPETAAALSKSFAILYEQFASMKDEKNK